MRKFVSIMAAALLCAPAQASAPEVHGRAVMVGGEAELDACATTLKVIGRNPQGEVWLAVRSSPSISAPQILRLRTGNLVYGCDSSRDGVWVGVVVYSANPERNCGVSSRILRRQAYRGPCVSGWVARRRLELVAG